MAGHKFNISFSDGERKILDELARAKGQRKADILRIAVKLMKFYYDEVEKGSRFQLKHQDGEVEIIRLFPLVG